MSPAVTRRKLVHLTTYLSDLKKHKNVSNREYWIHHYEIERLLQLIIEAACDINAHLLIKMNQKPPSSYYQSFIDLGKMGVLSQNLAEKLAPSSGLRNALVHLYEDIDEKAVRKSISLTLKYFPKYTRAIQKYEKR